MNAQGTGVAVGIAVGIVIVLVLMRVWNKDGRMKTRYDEMQQKIRGQAYKYAFWTVLIGEVIFYLLYCMDVNLPIDAATSHIIPVFIGITVQAGYSIWNDAYVGLNTNIKKFIIIAIVVALINFLSAGIAIYSGSMVENGVLQLPVMNLFVGVIFIVLGIIALIKTAISSKQED